ncbi:glycosyltransferase [candidate division KSB1 bacterium]
MEPILTGVALLLTFGYAIFLLMVITGLIRLRGGENPEKPFVSIVSAARNEESNIGALLEALFRQDYPPEKLEIIIVNDRSEDSTGEIALSFSGRNIPFTIIDIEDVPLGYSPKKFALSQGIKKARGEIICTTDADCIPPPEWVSGLVSYFIPDVGLVAGYSPLIVEGGTRFFSDYLYTDALALAVSSAGGIGWQFGLTCAGRNLAYRRSVFEEVGGYEDVRDMISGDDDLLMHMIQKKTDFKVNYAAGANATVPSIIRHGVGQYINQRTRHASKYRAFPFRVQFCAFTIVLFYAMFFVYPIIKITNPHFLPAWGFMLGVKFFLEFAAMMYGAKKLEAKFSFGMFLKAFFLHPFLVVFFSIRGARGKFTWKDRDFQQK